MHTVAGKTSQPTSRRLEGRHNWQDKPTNKQARQAKQADNWSCIVGKTQLTSRLPVGRHNWQEE
jgi:hypothetical protein